MAKARNKFGYAQKFGNRKPVKPTRLRNINKETDSKMRIIVGASLYVLSFICLIVACAILGVF